MTRGRFILMLIASHGVALGLGLALRGKEVVAPTAIAAVTEPPRRLELGQFIVRIPRDPAEEEEEESPEASEKAQREYEEKFARMVEAIPADTDVAALVKAGSSTDKDKYPGMEVEAAYAVWLMRDPLAALRWHMSWEQERGGSLSTFNISERYFLDRRSTADLDRLMVEDPEVGHSILMPALFAAQKKGLDQVVALAGGLSQGNNRYDVIRYGIRSAEGLAPHLPALRAMMDERGMYEFLSNIASTEHAGDLSEAVHAAGFPEAAVKAFDEKVGENAEKWRVESLPLAERIRESKDREDLDRSMAEALPDLSDWYKDFKGARLDADEIYGKLKAGVPGSEAVEPQLRSYLFAKLFPLDAPAALNWLQAGQADWQPVAKAMLEKEVRAASFEEYLDLAGSMSAKDAEASGLKNAMLVQLESWWERDPENCKAAVERLHASPLRDSLLEKISKEEARR
ncbi:hypothetical protein [Haloferula sp. BvORR071]|uniref:hypothetical protein n=1 Tax=Haloferula sp. BvORR071 TaxID=1396141 RepID=UPI000551049E|nr:hypothetical protein [Haloferula sp. BvORR071]